MSFWVLASALQLLLLLPAPSIGGASCRDRFLQPFSSASVWNMPIGSGARYAPARIFSLPPGDGACALRMGAAAPLRTACQGWNASWSPATCLAAGCCYDAHPSPDPGHIPWCFRMPGGAPQWGFHVDRDVAIWAAPADPLTDWVSQGDWGPDAKCVVTGRVAARVPLPALTPDLGCAGGNMAMGLLLPDNATLLQMQPAFRAPAPGAPLLAQFNKGCPVAFPLNVSILGDDPRGAHGGSGLSSIGGTVRAGELLPGAAIRHALKVELFAHDYYFSGGSDAPYTRCFAWPATGCDGYAHDGSSPLAYNGSNPALKPGALLAIPPASAGAVPVATEPGRILLAALTRYGAYLVDDTASDSAALCMERAAQQDLAAAYGIHLAGLDKGRAHAAAARGGAPPGGDNTTAFEEDLVRLFRALSVVANNANGSAGGGGAPLVPPAPPLCGA